MTEEEKELLGFIILMIEDMVCKVHLKPISNLRISKDELIAFSPCCEDFEIEVQTVIGNTINEFHGAPHLNKRNRKGGGKGTNE